MKAVLNRPTVSADQRSRVRMSLSAKAWIALLSWPAWLRCCLFLQARSIAGRRGLFSRRVLQAIDLAHALSDAALKAQNLTLADLLPRFTVAERGGVARIAELQAQGYAYLRP